MEAAFNTRYLVLDDLKGKIIDEFLEAPTVEERTR